MFNQLKEYRNTKGTKATYEYLPNNYRYSKTVGSTTTKFLWDGDYVAGELDSTGNISKKYFYGLDMLSDDSGNNYVYDIHGSVTDVLNSNGTKTNTYEYNAFGKDESGTSAKTSNAWQYCGAYKDNETGLIYLRNRYYNPETGRFINEDPIRSGGNWYSYASQNPIMFWDPFGLKIKTDKKDKDYVMGMLSDLSGGEMTYGEGYISGSKYAKADKPVGSQLVSSLIESDQEIEIVVLEPGKGEPYCHKDGDKITVYIQNEEDLPQYLPTINENNIITSLPTENYIVLGHELIHAYDYVFGGEEDGTKLSYIEDTRRIRYKEYYTTGLDPTDINNNTYENIYKDNVGALTENGLRIENNQPLRGRYASKENLNIGAIIRRARGLA